MGNSNNDTDEIPYYLTNPKWFRYNEKNDKDELTPEAPPEAVESYNEFYGLHPNRTYN